MRPRGAAQRPLLRAGGRNRQRAGSLGAPCHERAPLQHRRRFGGLLRQGSMRHRRRIRPVRSGRARRRGGGRHATIVAHRADQAVRDACPAGGSPICACRAAHGRHGPLDAVLACVTQHAIRRLHGPRRAPVPAGRALGRRDGRDGAVRARGADQAVRQLGGAHRVAEGAGGARRGLDRVAEAVVASRTALDVHHDLVLVLDVLDIAGELLVQGALIHILIRSIKCNVQLQAVADKTVRLP